MQEDRLSPSRLLLIFSEIPNSQVRYQRRLGRPLSKALSTICLLVNKRRSKLAEKLNEGDVTDQKFRGMIISEIDEIKSKLDGLARKDLLASISFFREGILMLYDLNVKEPKSSTTTAASCFLWQKGSSTIPNCFPRFFSLQKVDVLQARSPGQTRQIYEELLLFNKNLNHVRLLILVHQQALLRRIMCSLLQTLAREERSRQVSYFTYLRISQDRA